MFKAIERHPFQFGLQTSYVNILYFKGYSVFNIRGRVKEMGVTLVTCFSLEKTLKLISCGFFKIIFGDG